MSSLCQNLLCLLAAVPTASAAAPAAAAALAAAAPPTASAAAATLAPFDTKISLNSQLLPALFHYVHLFLLSPVSSPPGHRCWLGWWGCAKRQQESLLVGLVGMREASGPRSSSSSSTYSKSEPGPTCSKSGPGPTTQSLTRHPRIQRVSLGQPYKSAQKRSRVTSAAYSAYGVASPVAAFISCSSMSLSLSYTTSAPGT